MPRTIINSRLHPNKHKTIIEQEIINTKSFIAPHIQSYKQKIFSGNDFNVYK